MRKKRLIAALIAAIALSAGAFALAGCDLLPSNNTGDGNGEEIEQPEKKPDEEKEQEKPHAHTYDKRVADKKYLYSEATCTAKAVYYYSCECGEKGTETFEYGETLEHKFTNKYRYNEKEHWLLCDNCNKPSVAAVHKVQNSDCETCGYHATIGLISAPAASGEGYKITGIGEAEDETVFISSEIDSEPVTEISENAFSNCTDITKIIVPSTVKNIGDYAFFGCTELKEFLVYDVDTPQTVKTFAAKSRANDLDLPDDATIIGKSAFEGCKNLTNVEIPDGITEIGESAFYACIMLEKLNLGNKIESIGESAFSFCVKLKELALPETLSTIENGAFIYCPLENISVDTNNKTYHSKNNCLIETASKTLILGCKNSIILDDGSVVKIGNYAFCMCDGLESINIPDNVTAIGEYSFADCFNLKTIDMGNGVKTIGAYAFSDCMNLETVNFSPNVTDIGDGAFGALNNACFSLKKIYIPKSVTNVGSAIFSSRTDNVSLTIYCEATNAGENWNKNWNATDSPVIWDCKNNNKDEKGFEYAVIDGVNYKLKDSEAIVSTQNIFIGFSLNCTPYKVEFNVDIIRNRVVFYTFRGEYEFLPDKPIVIPENITYNGEEYKVTAISEKAFYNCFFTSITIPNSVTSIGEHAFEDCSGLTSVNIPDSVTSIGSYAFKDCSGLTSITIPDSVTSIGESAFYNCSGLTSITFGGKMAQWKAISKGSNWNYFTGDYTVTCTDGKLDKDGNVIE